MRILLLGATTGYQTREFAAAAKRLGIELTLATDRCHVLEDPWGDSAIPVRLFEGEPALEAVIEAGRKLPFQGIVALGDRAAVAAAQIAGALGLPYNSRAAAAAARNKFEAHGLFQAAGLPVTLFRLLPLDAPPQHDDFPCVLKPLGLSGSRGVIRADNPAEFRGGFERIRALLASPDIQIAREHYNDFIQVERFIPGREFALEGLLTNGRLQTLAIFDKPDPLNGPYFEETIYVTPSLEVPAAQHEIIHTTQRAIEALGLTHGPVHAEMRVNQDGVWMLEVAARPIGGLCARCLRFDAGVSLEELILRHACGEDVSGFRLAEGASGVMMIPIPKAGVYESVAGVDEALSEPGIEDVIVTAKQGQRLLPLPEGASYLGFLFARAATPALVERSLRAAHARLRFQIATALTVV